MTDQGNWYGAFKAAQADNEKLIGENKRMRHRIECLRGALKTASGWVWEGAANEVEANERADTLLALAGDMEPPLNEQVSPHATTEK